MQLLSHAIAQTVTKTFLQPPKHIQNETLLGRVTDTTSER